MVLEWVLGNGTSCVMVRAVERYMGAFPVPFPGLYRSQVYYSRTIPQLVPFPSSSVLVTTRTIPQHPFPYHSSRLCRQENSANRGIVRAKFGDGLCMQENSANRIIVRAKFGE